MTDDYETRYQHFLTLLRVVSGLEPRENYLYRAMDSLAFSDFCTALILALEDFEEQERNHG